MRILISTFYDGPNYGSRLQATALATYFQDKGYEVAFIRGFKAKRYLLRHPSLALARVYNKINGRRKKRFFDPVDYPINADRQRRLDAYVEKHFPEVSFDTDAEWQDSIKNRDIFVVGGDIIWQPALGYPTRNMLDFVYYTDLKRFSFGSSMGKAYVPKELRGGYRKYLSKFKAVGVREEGTARLLSEISGRPVGKVIDPTLLLDAGRWDKLAERAKLSVEAVPGQYILCYFVMHDAEYWDYVARLSAERHMDIIVLPMHSEDEQKPYKVVMDGTPYEFLWLIRNAAVVCTDSLHASIFSLIYKKQLQLLRRKRKAEDEKYDDFLSRYHLEQCVVSDRSTPKQDADIDFDAAYRQLDADRKNAFDFLDRALS